MIPAYGPASERVVHGRRSCARLRRKRLDLRCDRRRRLGEREPRARPARRREHEPRRGPEQGVRQRRPEFDPDGVSYAIAAGNSNANACNYSPARVAEAMTIGATDQTDRRASFSNRGNCLDWFAPGVGITSAWWTSNTATNTISGTSMATPHTAGVAALYLQGSPGASPATVRSALYANTTKDIVGSAWSANDHLLFTNY